MYEPREIAENIKEAASANGKMLKDLIKELGLGVNAFSNLRAGSSISSATLARIADALDCTVDSLLGRPTNTISLDAEEAQLIAAFRNLNTVGRQMLITTATAYTTADSLTKDARRTGTY